MRQALLLISIIGIQLLLNACSPERAQPNILDAATIYNTQPAAFAEITLSHPGPIVEFTRIPARDPAKETSANKAILKRLRKSFPVEYIDFYPRSAAGRDEIDVVIKRYGINAEWTVVSIVYLSKPLSPPANDSNMALFDQCDERSLEWLETNKQNGAASVFCQINEEWYAFQKVG